MVIIIIPITDCGINNRNNIYIHNDSGITILQKLFILYDFEISILQNNKDTFDGNVSMVFKSSIGINQKRRTL